MILEFRNKKTGEIKRYEGVRHFTNIFPHHYSFIASIKLENNIILSKDDWELQFSHSEHL